ncbi:MAG TPA: GNAT family N-acetyltransferase [Blastocatellia bacterium]|nr:GNAT family N-acetyltransferase [Blastocatellia bacterium]
MKSVNRKDSPLIRRATPADAELIAELGARTFADTFAVDNTPEDMSAYLQEHFSPARQASELADSAAIFLIAEVDAEAAGYAQLQSGEGPSCVAASNPIELARLYAAREWLGRGVGEALMRACVDEAGRAGHDILWLGVWERNERAKRFYSRWGFQKVGEHIFQLGNDSQTDWVMARAL